MKTNRAIRTAFLESLQASDDLGKNSAIKIYTKSSSKSEVSSKAKLHVWTWTRFRVNLCWCLLPLPLKIIPDSISKAVANP